MSAPRPVRFLIASLGCAAAGALVLFALGSWEGATVWAVVGWSIPVVLNSAGGVWLDRKVGSAGPGLVVALGAGMLLRVVAICTGAVVAARTGDAALWAFLAGFAAGFVPLQLFEIVWFLRPRPVAAAR